MCKSCSSTQIIGEIALFSGKIYTAGTNFTRPLVAAVATNLNSAMQKTQKALTYYSSTSNCSCSRECTMMLLDSSTWMDVIIIFVSFCIDRALLCWNVKGHPARSCLAKFKLRTFFLLSLSSFLHAHMEIAKSNGPAVLITIISQDKGCLCVVLKNRILTQNASWKELNQI